MNLKLSRLAITLLAMHFFTPIAGAQSNVPPAILTQPQNVVVAYGSNTTFMVSAGGFLPLAYQWQFKGTNLIGNPGLPPYQITTSSNLVITKATTTNAGPYDVVITNAWGSLTSSVVTLTIAYPPAITSQPVGTVVSNSNPVTFTIGATGSGLLTYQWLFTPFGQAPKGTQFLPNNIITLVAGPGSQIGSYSGDGGAATNAGLSSPTGVAVDAMGNLFIADRFNNRIREVDASGIITTVAGNAQGGYDGNGLLATNSWLLQPLGVAIDADENLFIADSLNQRVREAIYGLLITAAGNGSAGFAGDGAAAYNARLNRPCGVAVDASGNIYIADTANSRIRKVDVNDLITTVAGNGTNRFSGDGGAATNASLNFPGGVALDAFGNLLIADTLNNRIRRVDTNGIITTVAGTGVEGYNGEGIVATNAILNQPAGVAVDAYGQIFIADTYNNRIRKVGLNGVLSTVAGNFERGVSPTGGAATNTSLTYPAGVAVDDFENIYIADTGNQRVCQVAPQGPSLTLASVNATNGGYYQVIVSSLYGTVTSAVATLSVDLPPVITQQPINQTTLNGSSALFSVVAVTGVTNTTGLGLGYQWQFNGTNLPATIKSQYSYLLLNSVSSANAGQYDVVITNAFGSVTSRIVTLTVAYPPTITNEPSSLSTVNGGTASFTVGVTGTPPFSWQWQLNGTNLADGGEIIGATTTNLVLSPVSTNDAGPYDVVISSPFGSVTSTLATLTVAFPPVITNQPAGQSIVNGQNVTFNVGASGTAPLSYQWLFNGMALPAKAANIITTVAGNGQEGYSGDNGPATNATLRIPYGITVDSAGTLFIADSQNNLVRKVANGIITSVAGNGTLGYSGDGGPATNASIGVVSVAVDQRGDLFLADQEHSIIRKVDANGIITTVAGTGTTGYTGDGGPATNATLNFSSGVSLDGQGNLYIADQHNSVIRKIGTNGIISTVAGDGMMGYSGDGGAATNASLRDPFNVSADALGNLYIADNNNNVVRKVDTNGIITTVAGNGMAGYAGDGGSATNARLNSPSGVASDPAGNLYIADSANQVIRQVAPNGVITTLAGNGGTGYLGDGGAATNATLDAPSCVAVDLAGNVYISDTYNDVIRQVTRESTSASADSTLTLNDVTTTNTGNYQVIVTNQWGAATSTVATLNIVYPPAITNQPASLEVVDGGLATLGVAATGTAPLFYQWRFNGIDLTDGGNLSGSATATLVLNTAAAANAGSYDVIITNAWGSMTSSIATLAIAYPPVLTSQPASQTVLNGGAATFAVAASGTAPLSYQWQFDGTNLTDGGSVSGSATNTLVLTGVSSNSAGVYDVIVTSPWGSVTSTTATLTLAYPPSITSQPASQAILNGDNATFTIGVTGTGPFTYQWLLNGTNLPNDIISTVAGDGARSFGGDGGPAINASLSSPYGAAADGLGNVFVADTDNNRVRRIDPTGIITTVAGNGIYSYSGDGGPATNAGLSSLYGLTADASGNVYIADTQNDRVRKVATNGIITTIAGNGTAAYTGDGGPATNATLDYPSGVAADASGNVFIADLDNQCIRKVDTNGIITTVAGTGAVGGTGDGGAATNATLNYPFSVSVDAAGDLFIADTSNNRIREVTAAGIISTVAGNGDGGYSGDGGRATAAALYFPSGVAVDAAGNLFIADTDNNRIREVGTNGIITTVAGTGTFGATGDGGAATNATMGPPNGVALDAAGNLLIADWANERIRRVNFVEGPSLPVLNSSTNNAGGYQFIVSSPWGSVTSSIASLSILYTPTIIQSPTNLTAVLGGSATFKVAASGTAPLSYQWQFKGTNLTDAGNLSGSATTNLVLTQITTNNAGSYDVVVSNSWGRVTSSLATLTIAYPPVITNQPVNIYSSNLNQNSQFTVGVSGTAPLVYQWQYNGTNLAFQENVQGSTTARLVFDPVHTTNAGPYDVVISNPWGSVTSRIVTLNIEYAPVITSQPHSMVLTNFYSAAFSVGATGTGPFTYQWLVNGKIITNNIITTVAGTNGSGYSGDGGRATNARLNDPAGVTLDPAGNLFIADTYNERIRKVDAQGIITTVAGTGGAGYNGNGLLATNSSLDLFAQFPINGLAVDSEGNLFIADTANERIRVDAYGTLVTVAGTGSPGFSGDGGPAYDAALRYPTGLAVDSSGNIYFADTINERIRKIGVNDLITTVAGNGTAAYSGDGQAATNASIDNPGGVAVDALGNLFIADTDNNRVRKVSTNGIITTVAGNGSGSYGGDGGIATNAELSIPSGVAVDGDGNLYIADENNNRIRKVTPGGIITTVAGRSSSGYSGDGANATNSSLFGPGSVAVDAAGDLFIADARNNRVRKVTPQGPTFPLANLTTNNDGNYQVIVSDAFGSATSTVASLTLDLSPTITGQPAGEIVFAGGNATFFVNASGTPPLAYQWQFNGTNLPKAPDSGITLSGVLPVNAGAYQVVITNLYGSATSSVASLTVVLPEISAATATNDTVTFTLTTAPNVSSRVFASTNLIPPVIWTPIYTNVSGANGVWQFTDTNTTAYPARFYIISTP